MTRRGPNEGSIYQRESDGKWVGVLSLGFDSNGKRQRKTFYADTQRDVRVQLEKAKVDVENGLPIATEHVTVGQFLARWISDVEAAGRWAPSTLQRHKTQVTAHLIPGLGRHQLEKLTPQHVQTFLNEKSEGGLSPRSVVYLRHLLRQALTQAERWGMVPRNVAKLVDPPRMTRAEGQPLSPAEARRLLAVMASDRLSALYTVAVSVGLRQGEALGLRWADVDLDDGSLRVRSTLQHIDGEYQFRPPKTEKSRRTVALPQVAVRALRKHRSDQLADRLRASTEWEDWDLVFATPAGRSLHGPTVTRRFQSTLKKAGFRRLRFHDLRHGAATLLLAQGVDLKGIQETLGHSTIATTADIYAHMQPELRREVADRMDDALSAES